MINKKTAMIIGLQALLIVILFWMLVFYGKDEFENFRVEQEEEIESADRVEQVDGISIVSLSPAVQKNSGIETAKVDIMSFQGEVKSFGTVVPIDQLIAAKAETANLKAQLAASYTSKKQLNNEYNRLKTLNADDKNVSDLAVQQSLAKLNDVKASINRHALQMRNIEARTKLEWGTLLTNAAFGKRASPTFNQLLARKSALIQISLPFNAGDPKTGDKITITPLNGSTPITATYLSAAAKADRHGAGKTFYYSAPADNLRTGMRVSVQASASESSVSDGIVIPSNAVVWYAGTPWAYFKQAGNQFVRKPISADTEVDAGWFNTGFDAESEVVTQGAQLLLSEEFKYLIKNENDD